MPEKILKISHQMPVTERMPFIMRAIKSVKKDDILTIDMHKIKRGLEFINYAMKTAELHILATGAEIIFKFRKNDTRRIRVEQGMIVREVLDTAIPTPQTIAALGPEKAFAPYWQRCIEDSKLRPLAARYTHHYMTQDRSPQSLPYPRRGNF